MHAAQPDDLFRLMYTSGTTDRPKGAMHSYGNFYWRFADHVMAQGRFSEAEEMLTRALERARRRGDRPDERRLLAQRLIAWAALGRWDDVLRDANEIVELADDLWSAQTVVTVPVVLAARGDTEALLSLKQRFGAAGGWSGFTERSSR